MPKLSGKVKRRLYFEESDEDDSPTPKLSKKAQVLEDYFTQNNPPAARPSTSRARSPLLPTPELPVYHLKIEDYNVGDIVVKVCISFKQLLFNICNSSTHHSPHGLNQYKCIWLMNMTHGYVHPIQLMRLYIELWKKCWICISSRCLVLILVILLCFKGNTVYHKNDPKKRPISLTAQKQLALGCKYFVVCIRIK